jgi:hypothetical protein
LVCSFISFHLPSSSFIFLHLPSPSGFICGRNNDDTLVAPGISKDELHAAGAHGNDEKVCSDVALWWYIKSHYPELECDLIDPRAGHLTSARLQSNHINLLLG